MQAEVTHGIRTRGFGFWGGEMKTVKITIEVEVHDWATHVAVDGCGSIFEYDCEPVPLQMSPDWDIVDESALSAQCCTIVNWSETLTEVK
jgi:hypothetical protein